MQTRIISKNYQMVSEIVHECVDYALECEDAEQFSNYWKEIAELKNCVHENEVWNYIMNMGVFHDAVGELLNVTDETIEVLTEY